LAECWREEKDFSRLTDAQHLSVQMAIMKMRREMRNIKLRVLKDDEGGQPFYMYKILDLFIYK
jgi:hypothetical protein